MKQFFHDHPFWARLFVAFLLVIAATYADAQGAPGQSNYGGSGLTITTVAGLGSAHSQGKGSVAVVTDGTSATDCSTGGSSTLVLCTYSGSTWGVFSSGGIGYPSGSGLAIVSSGSAWGTTLAESNGTVAYGTGGAWTASSAPTISAANMTSFPTLNQNTTGTSGGLSGTPSITVNAVSATTYNGGALSGTFTGTPTASGVWTFSSTQTLSTSGNAATATALASVTGYSVYGSGASAGAWFTPTANAQCFMSAASSYATTSPSFQSCPSGSGTVTVVGAGALTSAALMTGGGTTTAQTPSTTSTLSSGGNMSLAGSMTAATGLFSTTDGTHTGALQLVGQTAEPTLASNSFAWGGPLSASFTSFGWNPPTAENGSAGVLHVGAASSHWSALTISAIVGADMTNNTVTATQLAAQYSKGSCQGGVGDGLNAIPAGTYLQTFCYNDSGVTRTITGVKCYVDGGSSSTLNGAGNTLGALLTGAVTCSTSFAAGTQSANVALTSTDYIKFTFVADGTAKQMTYVVTYTE